MIHKTEYVRFAADVRKELDNKFNGTKIPLGTGLTYTYKKAWQEKGFRRSFYDWELLIEAIGND